MPWRTFAFTTDYVDCTDRAFSQGSSIKLASQFPICAIHEICGEKIIFVVKSVVGKGEALVDVVFTTNLANYTNLLSFVEIHIFI